MFKAILNLIRGILVSSPEEREQRQIRLMAKTLRKFNPPVLEPKTEYLTPQFGYFLHATLRPLVSLIPSFRESFGKQNSGQAFYKYLINKGIKSDLLAELEHFSTEQGILEKSREGNLSQDALNAKFEEITVDYRANITGATKNYAEECLKNISRLSALKVFNPVSFFTEFNERYAHGASVSASQFKACEASLFLDDFMLFDKVISSLNLNKQFTQHLEDYYAFLGKDIRKNTLREAVKNLNLLKSGEVVLYLIHVIKKNFGYKCTPVLGASVSLDEMLEHYVDEVKSRIKVVYEKKNQVQIEGLFQQLFRERMPPSLMYYTKDKYEVVGEALKIEKPLKYHYELNLVYAFLKDIYNDSIKPIINFIVVKGDFSKEEIRKNTNDAFFQLNAMEDRIKEFDDKMSEVGSYGARLNRFTESYEKNKSDESAKGLLGSFLNDEVNAEAKELIHESLTCIKKLFAVLRLIEETHRQRSRSYLRNIMDFAGAKTSLLINNKVKRLMADINLFFRLFKKRG